ncbi:MAG: DUF3179 domain-containing protein [FCB group bacterium]|nr:DUF3179 domain-containing protein [FCB group bacterium]
MRIQKIINTKWLRPLFLITLMGAATLTGCKSDQYLVDLSPDNIPAAGTWLINENEIYWGCSGQDCIPGLSLPAMVPVGSSDLAYLDDADLVIGVRSEGGYYAYPHPVLDWHEVVNAGGYSISYCPLTGSAMKMTNDLDFGVSGMLYNSNLIMYDKSTNSFWPQMLLKSAAGSRRGTHLELDVMMETTWGTWRRLYPETLALSQNTGYDRDYTRYPYGSYKTDNSLYFPVGQADNRLPKKERVLGISNHGASMAFRLSQFSDISVLHTEIGDDQFVIFGSTTYNFAMAFKTDRHFNIEIVSINNGILSFRDAETESEWTIFGEAVDGELAGEHLEPAGGFIAYWFSWAAFNPETTVWDGVLR